MFTVKLSAEVVAKINEVNKVYGGEKAKPLQSFTEVKALYHATGSVCDDGSYTYTLAVSEKFTIGILDMSLKYAGRIKALITSLKGVFMVAQELNKDVTNDLKALSNEFSQQQKKMDEAAKE